MEAKGWILFNALVRRFHPRDSQVLLDQLSPEESQEVLQHPVATQDLLEAIAKPENRLKGIHASWLVPTIQQFPESMRPLILASLPKEQRQGVCQLLKQHLPAIQPSQPIRQYMLNELSTHLLPPDLLPAVCLPAAPLTPLASMSKGQLVTLIDYLGLRDLAEVVRPIVDKRLLQAIHGCLSPTELQLLRAYLHQREKLKVSKMDLTSWNGQRNSLRLMYHQRGLVRLAKALSGSSKDLMWHVTHILDQQRASVIEHLFNAEEIPGITPTLVQQVLSILEFLKRAQDE